MYVLLATLIICTVNWGALTMMLGHVHKVYSTVLVKLMCTEIVS